MLAAGGAALLFTALTIWIVDVRPSYLGRRLPGGLGDPVLNLYFLEWGGKKLAEGLDGFWDANFYYPSHRVMTFSDHLLGPAAEAALLRLLWDDPVAAYDFLFLGSYLLSGLAVTWVMRRNGASGAASVLAGIVFAFSPYRSGQESHLQVLLAQWLPLVLWTWDRLLAKPGLATAAAFAVCYALHVTGGNYLAYLAHFALLILLLQHRRSWRRWCEPRALVVLAPTLALCGALTLALYLPYLEAQREYGLVRGTGEIASYGADLRSYFSVERENLFWSGLLRRGRNENRLFAGLIPTVLAAVGSWLLARRGLAGRHRSGLAVEPPPAAGEESTFTRGVVWSGLFFFLLSFSWFYLPLARVVPGLDAMRVPTRGYPFVSLAIALLSALALDRMLPRSARARAAVASALGLALCIELDTHLTWLPWPRDPAELAIFEEIAQRPEVEVLLHLPLLGDAREAHYMWYSTLHWKPIVNGYSGFAPPPYAELAARLGGELPDAATLDYLADLGVTHITTHPRLLRAPRARRRLQRWQRRLDRGGSQRLRLELEVGADRLYRLVRAKAPPTPVAEPAPSAPPDTG